MAEPDPQSAIDDAISSLRAEWARPSPEDRISGTWAVTNQVEAPAGGWGEDWLLPPYPFHRQGDDTAERMAEKVLMSLRWWR